VCASGILVGSYRLGDGQFFINTLPIVENLNTHPAADRLLCNVIKYASANTHGRAAALPSDFDTQLKANGYSR
jgi:hypothetical protein